MEKLFKDVLSLICNKFEFSFTIDANGGLHINYNEGAGSCKLMLDESQQGLNEFVTALNEHNNKKEGLIDVLFFSVLGKAKKVVVKDYKKAGSICYNEKTWTEVKGGIDFTNEDIKKATTYTSNKLPGLLLINLKGCVSILYKSHLIGAGTYLEKDALQACIDKLTGLFLHDELLEHMDQVLIRKFIEAAGKFEVEQICNKATAEAKKQSKGYTITKENIYFSVVTFEQLDKSEKNAPGARRGRIIKVDAAPELDLILHDEIDGSIISLLFAGVLYEFEFEEGVDDFSSTELNAAIKKIERVGADEILKMAVKEAPKVLAAA